MDGERDAGPEALDDVQQETPGDPFETEDTAAADEPVPPPDLIPDVPDDDVYSPDVVADTPGEDLVEEDLPYDPWSDACDCTLSGTGVCEWDEEPTDPPSYYIGIVQSTVRSYVGDNPSLFDTVTIPGCSIPLNRHAFVLAIVAIINDREDPCLCAVADPSDMEISVRRNSRFDEGFAIVASNGCARYGGLIYTGRCTPSYW